MARLYAGSSQYVDEARLVHSGPGKVVQVIASHAEAAAQAVVFYDGLNPSAPVLLKVWLKAGGENLVWRLGEPGCLGFVDGLYVDPGGCVCHLVTVGGGG